VVGSLVTAAGAGIFDEWLGGFDLPSRDASKIGGTADRRREAVVQAIIIGSQNICDMLGA
jgi:hypothetical protein